MTSELYDAFLVMAQLNPSPALRRLRVVWGADQRDHQQQDEGD